MRINFHSYIKLSCSNCSPVETILIIKSSAFRGLQLNFFSEFLLGILGSLLQPLLDLWDFLDPLDVLLEHRLVIQDLDPSLHIHGALGVNVWVTGVDQTVQVFACNDVGVCQLKRGTSIQLFFIDQVLPNSPIYNSWSSVSFSLNQGK